jgi:hypothetical protein
MAEQIKLILGVPYPWPKEHENLYVQVLEKYNVKDLDTGSSYVSLLLSSISCQEHR